MKIIKNYLYNVTYQVFVLLVPLVTTPYISRVLGTKGVGINAYTNSFVQYFVLIATLGVNLYGNRTIAYERDDKTRLSQAFWEMMILKLILTIIAMVLFVPFTLMQRHYRTIYWMQAIQIIAVFFDISWLFVGLEDFKKTVTRNIITKFVCTIGIFVFVKSSSDVVIYVLLLAGSTLIGNISMWGYLKRIVQRPNVGMIRIFRHLRGTFELFIPQVAMQVYLVLNKTMLGWIVGVTSVGYYENADKLVKLSLTIVTAIATVMTPRMSNTYIHKDFEKLKNYLYSSIDFVTFLSILLTAGLAGVSTKFSVWFMGEEFAITGQLIALLSLVCLPIAWSTVIGSQYLVTTEQTFKFTIAVTVGAVSNVLFNFVLINAVGVVGAVISTVLSEVLITSVEIWMIREQIILRRLFVGFLRYIIIGVLTYFVIHKLNILMPGNFLSFLLQTMVGIVLYYSVCTICRIPSVKDVNRQILNVVIKKRNS